VLENAGLGVKIDDVVLRLRKFGLIKKVAHSYRYSLTQLGRSAIAAACRITEQTLVHALAGASA